MHHLLVLPFLMQAIAIGIDEGYFHIQRGLPKWERIGHPMDTLSVIICLAYILLVPFSSLYLKVYIGLAIFSCIMVTKDEFVHKHHCKSSENWLHALLFVLHPITLASAGLMWPKISLGTGPNWLKSFLTIQVLLMVLFFIYQIIFWSFVWKNKKVTRY